MNKTRHELERFSTIMTMLASEFGGTITPELVTVRFGALSEYTIEQIGVAATWLLKNRQEKYPPVPTTKEIIDTIKRLECPPISTKSTAEIQVDIVLDRLHKSGRYGSPKFDDPITQKLMETRWPFSRWAAIVETKELKWWRKEFIEAYEAYKESYDAKQLHIESGMHEDVMKFINNRSSHKSLTDGGKRG